MDKFQITVYMCDFFFGILQYIYIYKEEFYKSYIYVLLFYERMLDATAIGPQYQRSGAAANTQQTAGKTSREQGGHVGLREHFLI